MKSILETSYSTALKYDEYRNLVTNLFQKGLVTGNEQSESLVHYTELNEARMKRLDKLTIISEETTAFLQNLTKDYIWLVISEGWCGDAAQILPIVNKMALVSDKIHFKIVLRDDNEELMNLFLTNGSKSIPKLIVIEKETMKVIGEFGPRPKAAIDLVKNYKEKFGIIDETVKTDLQKWYLSDKGISVQKEIIDLMKC
jgi:hypothetical protein